MRSHGGPDSTCQSTPHKISHELRHMTMRSSKREATSKRDLEDGGKSDPRIDKNSTQNLISMTVTLKFMTVITDRIIQKPLHVVQKQTT